MLLAGEVRSVANDTGPPSPGLLYLHGAGLDTWIWEEHVGHLETPTLAASFPGREGSGVASGLGLPDYVDHVSRQIEEWSVDEFVVVPHSIGGVVGTEVAAAFPERVVGFVGVCAAIPTPGGSFLSCLPFPQRTLQRILTRVIGTNPPDSVVRRSLCRGLSEEDTDRVVEGYVPESRKLYTDRIEGRIPDLPAQYVETTDDPEFGSALQAQMAANLSAGTTASLASGHLPMLSHPAELASILKRFVERSSEEH